MVSQTDQQSTIFILLFKWYLSSLARIDVSQDSGLRWISRIALSSVSPGRFFVRFQLPLRIGVFFFLAKWVLEWHWICCSFRTVVPLPPSGKTKNSRITFKITVRNFSNQCVSIFISFCWPDYKRLVAHSSGQPCYNCSVTIPSLELLIICLYTLMVYLKRKWSHC